MTEKEKIIKHARQLCIEHDCHLLFLSKFGSHLYGTNTPDSDTDYKGIFLPSKKRCCLMQNIKSITESTGKSDGKNTSEDIDMQLWSLQYFLEMVSKGETNALDLLYAPFYREMTLYMDSKMPKLFNHHGILFDIKDCNAFIGYAIGQAKKYGIKGSRLGVIKKICDWFCEYNPDAFAGKKLQDYAFEISDRFHDPSYCFNKTINGKHATVICGKVHLFDISMEEFVSRITRDYEKYGERARAAERSEGIDWKALSHAVRALYQMEELIETGRIVYPLKRAPEIMKIKQGKTSFPDVEKLIRTKISEIDLSLKNLGEPLNKKDSGFIRSMILSFYEI